MDTAGESTSPIMKQLLNDGDSVESAKQDLNIIFNKINNSLRDLDEKIGVKDKDSKCEVSFKIEDHHHEERSTKAVRSIPEASSVPSTGTIL